MEELKLGVIIAQIVNFMILMWVFKFFIGDKILAVILERKTKIKMLENADAEAKMMLEKAQDQAHDLLTQSRKKWEEIENAMHNRAMQKKEQMLATAHFQAENMMSIARSEIEKEKAMMVSFLKSQVLTLAYGLNKKLFTSQTMNTEFLQQELARFSQKNDE